MGAVVVALLVLAPGASANFHLMKVREVATNPAGANSAFIELQMYASGQNFVGGHSVNFYTADGTLVDDDDAAANVGNGDSQRTILIGDTATAGRPDFSNPMLSDAVQTYGPGGAACFDTIDCVSWGNFTGAARCPRRTGSPAPAIADGSSLTRSIAPGCATLLEAADDTDNSAADFALATPSPRNNSTAPTETACDPAAAGTTPRPRPRRSRRGRRARSTPTRRRSSSSRTNRARASSASSTARSTSPASRRRS